MESTFTLHKRLPPNGLAFIVFSKHKRVFFIFINRLCAAYCALLVISHICYLLAHNVLPFIR